MGLLGFHFGFQARPMEPPVFVQSCVRLENMDLILGVEVGIIVERRMLSLVMEPCTSQRLTSSRVAFRSLGCPQANR